MKRIISALPVWVVLVDMLYGFVLNVLQSLDLNKQGLPKDGLPVAPDIAFSGLQVVANGGMVLATGLGLLVLLRLNRTVLQRKVIRIGMLQSFGLLTVLVFTAPALWEWAWALLSLAQGQQVVSLANPRYLIVALCLPWVGLLCLARLFGWYRLHERAASTKLAVKSDAQPTEGS